MPHRFRPAGRPPLPRRQRRQTAAGGGLRWASPPIVAPPPDPHLREIPLHPSAKVPARKIRFRTSFLPGHWALVRCKILACAILPPRLVPTSRGRGRRVGDASIGTAPKTGNGRASVPPLRYEKKVLLQRNDGRGKPLPCGMGGETLCGKGLRPLLLSERKNGGPSGPPFAAPLIPRRSYSNKQAVRRASRSPLRWGRRL